MSGLFPFAGYRFLDRSDYVPLDAGAVLATLDELAGVFALEFLAECDSTNSRLMAAPPSDEGRVHVLATELQTAGRGRRGRVWQSWPGASLSFSSLWRFAPGAPVPAGLSLVAGLAVAEALEELGVEGVQLKWPNDVLVHGHKLAGILVELSSGRGRTLAAVVGIGINLKLPAEARVEHSSGVTDLAACLARPPTASRVLGVVLRHLHRLFRIYGTAGFGALRGAWQQRNAFADLPVNILGESSTLTGNCAGVDEDGALLLDTPEGVQRILSGDVSLRLV